MPDNITPMARQYQDIKSRHQDAILFFRLGDFYEMFNDDAKIASKELELTLTGRGEGGNRMPMCGIPYHAASNYIARLIGKGYKVAICEQLEDPATAKGVVKRDVIKVISPGTVQETGMLNEKTSNYLLAVSFDKKNAGLAYIDASTGEFKATSFDQGKRLDDLIDEIKRVNPSEVLLPDIIPEHAASVGSIGYPITVYKDTYDAEIADKRIAQYFAVASLESFGLKGSEAAYGAIVAVLDYLAQTQKADLLHVNNIQAYKTGDFMFIDQATRRNLELLQTVKDRGLDGSLIWVLDSTVTPMGARLLKKWITQPLLDAKEINLRLDAVEELSSDLMLRERTVKYLKAVFDIERLVGRVASSSANARDLVQLKESLKLIPLIKESIKECGSISIRKAAELEDHIEVIGIIEKAIAQDPPLALKEGGLIRPGYDEELDAIKQLAAGGKQWITELELHERARTGIKSLKVGYTSVFGYYIEVSRSNISLAPSDYIRKQTLVNCERFITPELKEKEALILDAEDKIFSLEYKIFENIRGRISAHTKQLQLTALVLAELDVLVSLANVAVHNKYVKPAISCKNRIKINEGRHPVVERVLGANMFVPNDTDMDRDKSRFLLITGPNMAGKSTYMRQVALICLMAQIGSFVPASAAELPIIDRIFTRIGAMDDIFAGQSTFMVEMTETANIINNASSSSLVILDEIGRGTSTFDGMSIAAAVSEYIHNQLRSYALFATHYHEITQLAQRHAGMKNYSTMVKKEGDQVIFMHKIIEGAADQSYGIEVAKLAGLPDDIVNRAKEIYSTLEMVEKNVAGKKQRTGRDQMGLF